MPEWAADLRSRLAELHLNPARETEIVEELSQHLDQRYSELRADGVGEDEARRAVVNELTEPEALEEFMRPLRQARVTPAPTSDPSTGRLLGDLFQDLRYAARTLRRQPGFAAAAILTLALGIGANTAMFAVVNAVLLKPLPFRDADRLMLVHRTSPNPETRVVDDDIWSYPKYQVFLEIQDAFEDSALFAGREMTISDDLAPERVHAEIVTEGYLGVLGLSPLIGRPFSTEEGSATTASPVTLISHGLWTRRFGADPAVLGRVVRINGTAHAIIGVLPPDFRGLTGNADVWVPLGTFEPRFMTAQAAQAHNYQLVARRKSAVPEPTASAAVRHVGQQIDAAHPSSSGAASGARAVSLYDSRADPDVRQAALLLLGAVGCVLLIACVNLTNLAGAKAFARGREVAIRMAIGATRHRLMRQFLAEGALLAALGGMAGLILASALLQVASVVLPDSDVFFRSGIAPDLPRIAGAAGLTRIGASMISLDAATLLFTVGITLAAAIGVAFLPAARVASVRPIETLKADGPSSPILGLRALNARSLLVAMQIGMSLVVLICAGLMLRSAAHLYATPIGVTGAGVIAAGIELPRARYNAESGSVFFARLLEEARAIPGVDVVALGSCAPVSGGCNRTIIWPAGRAASASGDDPVVAIHWMTPDFIRTLGVRVVSGRGLSENDRAGQPKVALVNETTARTLWPGESALGKRIAVGQGGFGDGAEIVGVVSDVRYVTVDTAARSDVFIPLAQSFRPIMWLFVRSRVEPSVLVPAIRHAVRSLDSGLALSDVKTMQERVDDAMWRTRVGAWILSVFAGLALLLTSVGIFGVMAQTVAQRTREIGIRLALGADRRTVLWLVFRRLGLVTAAGLAVGIICALGLTQVIGALLYEVKPEDPVTFLAVSGLLAAVALIACYVPARRATQVSAITALRTQ